MKPFPESGRTPEENLEILRFNAVMNLSNADNEFAGSLMGNYDRRGSLTEKQWYWVDQLASRCIKAVADYGHKTGRCQICRRKLTDPKSIKHGYGPTCAHNNGLPYG